MRNLVVLAMLSGVAWGQGGTSVATNAAGGKPLSDRIVEYGIDANVDMQRMTLNATETLTYKNETGVALTVFPFHLYLNAFQPESTFTQETHFGGGIRDSEGADAYPAKKLGSIALTELTADGMGDLTARERFVAPDDGNAKDRTVMEVTLPRAVGPGESVTFRMRFHDVFPESVARNGYRRDFLMGGQWFPKVGVWWHGGWNCHQYHATTEFFSDFGVFHVRLTLPKNEVVGASGVPVGDVANADGTQTLSFYAEDVGDFAWAASPNFTVTTGTFLSSMGPVEVRVLALKAHPGAGERYLTGMLRAMEQFDVRYGPYPYKVLTVVDPEPDSEMAGMEYPTLITAGTARWDPTHLTEVDAEHEFGHQYWYGMVATNEFEDAWLDEGINSYTEVNVMAALYGEKTSLLDWGWLRISDASERNLSYIGMPDYDPVVRYAWEFRDSGSYGAITYSKSAMLLKTLEGIVGRDTMDEAMRTYFMKYRFTHPDTTAFLNTIAEVAIRRGRATGYVSSDPRSYSYSETALNSSLNVYFDQAVYGTRVLDYAVDSVVSGPAQWWAEGKEKPVRSSVTVHRVGDFVLPVTVEVRFADGSKVREVWAIQTGRVTDENDRWKTFVYVRDAAVVSAEVDPDHTVWLDGNKFNDSYVVKANPVPARKLTNLWMSGLQLLEQAAGWLV